MSRWREVAGSGGGVVKDTGGRERPTGHAPFKCCCVLNKKRPALNTKDPARVSRGNQIRAGQAEWMRGGIFTDGT